MVINIGNILKTELPVTEEVYPICSNMFFLVPVWVGVKNKHYKSSIFLFITMIFSSIYHTCDNILREQHNNINNFGGKKTWVCWGISYNSLQFLDFFYARLCISMICMKICNIPKEHKENIFHVYYSLILIITVLNRHNMIYTGSIVSFDLLVPVVSTLRTLYYWCNSSSNDADSELKRPYTLSISRDRFIGCCIFFIAGIVCFEESTPTNYTVMHSLWHVFMSISCAIVLTQPQPHMVVIAIADDSTVPTETMTTIIDDEFDRPYTRQRGLS